MKSIPEIMNDLFNATKDKNAMKQFQRIYSNTAKQWEIESNPIGGFELNQSHLYAFVANATKPDGNPATNENGIIYSTDDIIRITANNKSQYSINPTLEYNNIMSGLKNIIQNIELDIKKHRGGKKRSHTLKKTKTKRNKKTKKTKKITKKYKGKKRRKINV
tara:strand:- start:1142 stop:1627 length:486 start_codon:yes stop_codon:yes gene_type:complete